MASKKSTKKKTAAPQPRKPRTPKQPLMQLRGVDPNALQRLDVREGARVAALLPNACIQFKNALPSAERAQTYMDTVIRKLPGFVRVEEVSDTEFILHFKTQKHADTAMEQTIYLEDYLGGPAGKIIHDSKVTYLDYRSRG